MSPRTQCTVLAPAKINLGLSILGKRPDGYHELDSLLVAIDLYDQLHVTRANSGGIQLKLNSQYSGLEAAEPFPVDDRNLIVRAIHAMESTLGIHTDLRIGLEKVIPVAAGLGGGSSDAAAAIAAVNVLYDLNLDTNTLQSIAAQVGSDVPFFLNGPAAKATGRGEQLQPCEIYSSWWALLLASPTHVSTAEVYSQLDLTYRKPKPSFAACDDKEGFFTALRQSRNDLEVVAIHQVPELVQLKAQLEGIGAESVFVTGSGPTVVGVFDHRPTDEAIASVQSRNDQVRVLTVQPVKTTTALVVR